jgi:hypothetical protein
MVLMGQPYFDRDVGRRVPMSTIRDIRRVGQHTGRDPVPGRGILVRRKYSITYFQAAMTPERVRESVDSPFVEEVSLRQVIAVITRAAQA